jgi:hypothetical protein
MFTTQIYALLEPNGAAIFTVHDLLFTLDEASFEQHFERVLKMEQHRRRTTVIFIVIERPYSTSERSQCFPFERTGLLAQLHFALFLSLGTRGCTLKV